MKDEMLSCAFAQDRSPFRSSVLISQSSILGSMLIHDPFTGIDRALKPIRWHEQDWTSRMDTNGLAVD
jgi:hypothetical protein